MKETEFSKAPEFATHYFTTKGYNPVTEFYRETPEGFEFYNTKHCAWERPCQGYCWCLANLLEIPKQQWTPQSNTLPLRDLSDEQAAKLFNAWRKNQEILERLDNIWHYVKPMQLSLRSIYRIKPKSERELFVEACTEEMRKAGTECPENHQYFGVLFDSGKFKLVNKND